MMHKVTFHGISTKQSCVSRRPTHIYSSSPDRSDKKKITLKDISVAIQTAMEAQKLGSLNEASYWDIVHELDVHYTRQQKKHHEKTKDPLEVYCEVDESALECKEYDV